MARKKVKLAWITNDTGRRSTLKKRRKGLIKKISELTVLCGVDGCAVIYNPEERNPEVWPNQEEVRRILTIFQSLPEGERTRKTTTQHTFMQERIVKMKDQLEKQVKQNREQELRAYLCEGLAGSTFADANAEVVSGLSRAIEENIIKVAERIQKLRFGGNDAAASALPLVPYVAPIGSTGVPVMSSQVMEPLNQAEETPAQPETASGGAGGSEANDDDEADGSGAGPSKE